MLAANSHPKRQLIAFEPDPRKRPWYLLGRSRPQNCWGTPYPDIVGGKLLLSCVRALFDGVDSEGASKFTGVIGADMTLRYLVGRLLRPVDVPGVVESLLLDGAGKILARSSGPAGKVVGQGVERRLELETYKIKTIVDAVREGRSGSLHIGQGEQARVVVFQRLATVAYTLVVSADAGVLFRPGR